MFCPKFENSLDSLHLFSCGLEVSLRRVECNHEEVTSLKSSSFLHFDWKKIFFFLFFFFRCINIGGCSFSYTTSDNEGHYCRLSKKNVMELAEFVAKVTPHMLFFCHKCIYYLLCILVNGLRIDTSFWRVSVILLGCIFFQGSLRCSCFCRVHISVVD